MSQFFISCKESKIENNRSFYGCFHLGPFEPSQSITIANALRRTLLSELYGLSIISVEIEGATHEYSNLNGVKDSVLDILLNLKEIIFKKSINPLCLRTRWNFGRTGHEQGIKPQIGYLKARGPGLVRASNLRLPPFIQCVDPDQYIATLAEDGFLNVKFIIQYGNKWACMVYGGASPPQNDHAGASPQNSNLHHHSNLIFSTAVKESGNQKFDIGPSTSKGTNMLKDVTEKEEIPRFLPVNQANTNGYDFNSPFNLHLKKRRLILKKLRHIGLTFTNSYINMLLLPSNLKKEVTSQLLSHPTVATLANLAIVKKLNQKYPAINLQIPVSQVTLNLAVNQRGKKKKISNNRDRVETRIYNYASHIPSVFKPSTYADLQHNKKEGKVRLGTFLKASVASTCKSGFTTLNQLRCRRLGVEAKKKKKSTQPSTAQLVEGKRRGACMLGPKPNSSLFFNSNPLTIDAVFNPIIKVNYIIEVNDFKTTQNSFETSVETLELFEILNITGDVHIVGKNTNHADISQKPFLKIGSSNFMGVPFEPPISGEVTPSHAWSLKKGKSLKSSTRSGEHNPKTMQALSFSLPTTLNQLRSRRLGVERLSCKSGQYQSEKENLLKIKREINSLKKEIPKHNIILEIWTNGSIHPRDAIYEGLKNLVKLFSKLNKINAFILNPFILNSLSPEHDSFESNLPFLPSINTKEGKSKEGKRRPDILLAGDPQPYCLPKKIKSENENIQTKKIKQNEIPATFTDLQDLVPLNETSFLSTYMSPKVKNYYSKNTRSTVGVEASTEGKRKKEKSDKYIDSYGLSVDTAPAGSQVPAWSSPTKIPPMQVQQKSNKKKVLGSFDLGILNLSLRSYTCLKRLNVNTIDELIDFLKNNSFSLLLYLPEVRKKVKEGNSKSIVPTSSSFFLNTTHGNEKTTIQIPQTKLSKFSLEEIERSLQVFLN